MVSRLTLAVLLAAVPASLALADDSQPSKTTEPASQSTNHRWPRVRFGGFAVNAGYTHFSGPGYYPYGYYGPWAPWGAGPWGFSAAYSPFYWDPFYYGPYLHPGFFRGFGYGGPAMGEVKLKTADKDAWIYLDGALAGKADKLKDMWLEAGAYNLEVRSGPKTFSRKIYVLSGKSMRLTADIVRGEVRP